MDTNFKNYINLSKYKQNILFADFHIHSKYSLATSKENTFENIIKSTIYKGISIIGTGDILHHKWRNEFIDHIDKDSLINDCGIYFPDDKKLRNILRSIDTFENKHLLKEFIAKKNYKPLFLMLTTEISFIYKDKDKTKKNHILLIFSSFKNVEKLINFLNNKNYNLNSDGRPTLKISPNIFFDILLDIDPYVIIIPAHIWTPWFSTLGSKSGFDSMLDAFGEHLKYIKAIETGLSTDPPMHWLCSFLDNFNLVSNSDAHNTSSIGRNATIFYLNKPFENINFKDMIFALENNSNEFYEEIKSNKNIFFRNNINLFGTINLFPQLGKYYFDGHRNCNFFCSPIDAKIIENKCPFCKKSITKGVLHRIFEIKDRNNPEERKNKRFYKNIIPLLEIFELTLKNFISKKKILFFYNFFISNIERELDLLTFYEKQDVENLLLENIEKILKFNLEYNILTHNELQIFFLEFVKLIDLMNNKKLKINEGFDGKYGSIIN
ncbi:MAG: endonuclease Q family protein [Spirochaetes bacterium]|nr:endonuclease Q family protein [Spirochaetota bacterium]